MAQTKTDKYDRDGVQVDIKRQIRQQARKRKRLERNHALDCPVVSDDPMPNGVVRRCNCK